MKVIFTSNIQGGWHSNLHTRGANFTLVLSLSGIFFFACKSCLPCLPGCLYPYRYTTISSDGNFFIYIMRATLVLLITKSGFRNSMVAIISLLNHMYFYSFSCLPTCFEQFLYHYIKHLLWKMCYISSCI